MPQCWQIISLSRRRSKSEVERSPSSNLLTCYVGGHWRHGEWGERGRWLRVNIMHAWLPPDPTQHEQLDQWADPTDSALFEWINATHQLAPPRPYGCEFEFWILGFEFEFRWFSVYGLRLTGFARLSILTMASLLFGTSAAACYAVLCRVFWPQIISIAIALRIALISSPFCWVPRQAMCSWLANRMPTWVVRVLCELHNRCRSSSKSSRSRSIFVVTSSWSGLRCEHSTN